MAVISGHKNKSLRRRKDRVLLAKSKSVDKQMKLKDKEISDMKTETKDIKSRLAILEKEKVL